MNYYENETATGTPKATWEFKTDAKGEIHFIPSYKSSGPEIPTYQSGNQTRYGIPAGSSISIKEKTAPAGYQLDSTTYKVAFKDAGEGKIQRVNLVTGTTIETVNVSNAPDVAVASQETPGTVSINVTKKANGTMPTGATLDGVKFALVSRNGSKPVVVGNKTYTGNNTILEILTVSGSNGAATATVTSKNKYPAGNYRVYELRSDATYQAGDTWDGNSTKHGSSNTANAHFGFATNQLDVTISGVQATAGTTISAGTATNTPSPKYFDATVKKVDAAGKAVAGAKFNLRYDGTDHVGTTGADGSYTWKNIPWTAAGTSATLTETSAPAGYQIDPAYAAPGKSITLKADPGATYNLGTVTNTQLVKIKINKQANGTMPPGATLDGIKFAIVSRNGSKQIQIGGKTYTGNDTILEILTISGSNGANTASVTSANSFPVGNYRVYELRSDNTYAVGDTWDGNSAKHGSSTSANAHFRFATNQLNVTVDGAQVVAGATVNAGTATNGPLPTFFEATLKKVDAAGKPVAGATFNLRYDGTDHVGTTGADGTYTWKNIPWTAAGTAATLTETKAPAGYQIDPAYAAPGKSITLTGNPGITYNLGTVTNAAVVSATLKKVDDAGQPIAGVVFNLKYDNADHKKTTGADGTATWTGIISGTKATLIEESVPAGYNMDPAYAAPGKAFTITADAGETYNLGTITNTAKTTQVTLKKVSEDGKVEGFKFTITGTRSIGGSFTKSGTTDAKGEIDFGQVPYGNYTVEENLTAAQKLIYGEPTITPEGFTISDENQTQGIVTTAKNELIRGQIKVVKTDKETGDGSVQGNASLEGIQFAIVNRTGETAFLPNGSEIADGAIVAILSTDKKGEAATPAEYLQMGKYEVVELRKDSVFNVGDAYDAKAENAGESILANDSYLYAEQKQSATLEYEGTPNPTVDMAYSDTVVKGGVSITKRDFYTDDIPQGDAGFIGVRYAVINRSAEEVLLPDGTVIPKDAVALVLSADKDGKAQSSAKALAYGTYDVIELRIDSVAEIGKEVVMGSHKMANYSYLWKDLTHRIEVREEGKIYEATKDGKVFENEPEEPKNPELFKFDIDLGTNKTQGGASFEGIQFALINRSANPVFVEHFEKLFVPGQVIDVIASTADGIIELPFTMSYGTYGLMELPNTHSVKQGDMFDEISDIVKYGLSKDRIGQLYANASYMYTDREEKTFKAITRADGHVEYDTSMLHFDNKVVRAGIYFEKKIESTQEHLPYVVFKVTLKETGETHYIMTNHNAYYGTDQLYNKHSNNTNGIDAIVKPYAEEGFIPQAIIDELIEKEAWHWGTWFGTAAVNDEDMALPFGSYDMEEIKSPANEQYFMYRNDDFKIWYNYQYHSFGTIFNRKMGILTSAVDARTNTREGFATKNAKILDTVTYNGLVPGASYELVATLMAKNAEGKWEQIKGVEVHKTFIPKVENHYEVMEIVFDASSYEDKDVVVFEELRDANGTVIAEHKSLTDAKQTVSYKPVPKSGMAIVKEAITVPANGIAYLKGETVKYQITVTNPGEVDLRDVEVEDAALEFEAYIGLLRSGKSRTFTVTYKITEEDTLAGKFINVATATTEDPTSSTENPKPDLTEKDEEEVPAMEFKPGYEQNKEMVSTPKNGIAYVEGEVITFKLSLKNTGNQPLTITVKDELVAFEKEVKLAPCESWAEEVYYTVTEADALTGHVLNVLTSKGIPPFCPPEEPPVEITPPPVEQDPATMIENPAYEQEKSVISKPKNGIAYVEGETIVFKLSLKNTGNLPLIVKVSDKLLGFEEEVKLAVEGSWEVELTYEVTEDDAKAGHVLNVLTSEGKPERPEEYPDSENDPPIVPEDKEVEVPTIDPNPHISIIKETVNKPANGVGFVEGEEVIFRITVINDGNMDFDRATVKDEMLNFEAVITSFVVGDKKSFDLKHTTTREEAEAGRIYNVATVTAPNPNEPNDPEKPTITEKDDEENPATLTGTVTVIYVDKKGKVLIEKTLVLEEVPVGTEYKTTEKEIEHYRFVEMGKGSAPASGKVAEGTQDIIYVYEIISQPQPAEPVKEPETEPRKEEESKGNIPPAPIPPRNTPPDMGDRNILPFYILLFIGTLGAMLLLNSGKDWEG